jgi:alpha-mannosidase
VVDAGDETTGMSAFVDGLTEYEVVAGEEARLALTLLRCVGFLSRDDLATREGHAGPGLATPGAQCPGSHTFRFALAPRAAPPAAAALFAEARDFLSPPRVVAHAGGAADGPASRSLLEAGDDVVLSACVRSEDGAAAVLRVFNPGGEPARGGAVAPGRIAVVKVARRAAP